MNPLQLMNNDMATLMLSSRKLFEHWNDNVADTMKRYCIEEIQRDWNAYLDGMNTRMNIFMMAERKIEEEMSNYKLECNN